LASSSGNSDFQPFIYRQHPLIKDSVSSLFPEKERGLAIFGSLIRDDEDIGVDWSWANANGDGCEIEVVVVVKGEEGNDGEKVGMRVGEHFVQPACRPHFASSG